MRLHVWKYFKKKTLFNVIIYPKTIQGVFMANEVKGVDRPLKDILATELGSYYQIPDYQRPYQWTEKTAKSF